MSLQGSGTSYLTFGGQTRSRVPGATRGRIIALASALLAVFVLIMTINPFSVGGKVTPVSIQNTQAGWPEIWCSTNMGLNMDGKQGWQNPLAPISHGDKSGRTWTLQEAMGNSAFFVNYVGEGKAEDQFGVRAKPEVKDADKVGNYTEISSKLTGIRTTSTCLSSHMMTQIANLALTAASLTTGFADFIVVKAFDPGLICSKSGQSGCLDMVGIVGGNGGTQEGIIGTLTNSLYFPLLVIVVFIAGVYIGHKALVKRQFREATFGLLWVFGSVIIGLLFLLNPVLLAKAPMAVSNSITTCVVGSFNGQNCFDGSTTRGGISVQGGLSSSEGICLSNANGLSVDERMSLTAASLSCSIWKAFVLNPVSDGSFGVPFDALDTQREPLRSQLVKAKLDPNSFCVNLGSTSSADRMGSTLVLDRDSNKVCNLMAYQLYLQTNAHSGNEAGFTTDPTVRDMRWYKVVVAAANNDSTWWHWAPSPLGGFNKITLATISLITSALGNLILVVTAVVALVYYISSVILIAFAPLFLLLGVDPGRGRRVLLGWVEKVISNVLKYLASAVFLIVTIAFYGAVLKNIDNIGMTILFVIILTMALFMYRNELISLMGRVSMGGEQLSSRMTDSMKNRSKSILRGGGRLAGSAVGAGIGAGVAGGFNAENVFAGAKDGVFRQVKRNGGSIIGGAVREIDRATADNKSDLRTMANDAQGQADDLRESIESNQETLANDVSNLNKMDHQYETDRGRLGDLEDEHEIFNGAEDRVLRDMSEKATLDARDRIAKIEGTNTDQEHKDAATERVEKARQEVLDFSELKSLESRMRDGKLAIELAVVNGDMEAARNMEIGYREMESRHAELASGIDTDNLARLNSLYDGTMDAEKSRLGISDYDDDAIAERHELALRQVTGTEGREDLVTKIEALHRTLDADQKDFYEAQARSKSYNDAFIAHKPGQGIGHKDMARYEEEANEAADASMDKWRQERKSLNDVLNENASDSTPKFTPLGRGQVDQSEFGNVFDRDGNEVMRETGAPLVGPARPDRMPSGKSNFNGPTKDDGSNGDEQPDSGDDDKGPDNNNGGGSGNGGAGGGNGGGKGGNGGGGRRIVIPESHRKVEQDSVPASSGSSSIGSQEDRVRQLAPERPNADPAGQPQSSSTPSEGEGLPQRVEPTSRPTNDRSVDPISSSIQTESVVVPAPSRVQPTVAPAPAPTVAAVDSRPSARPAVQVPETGRQARRAEATQEPVEATESPRPTPAPPRPAQQTQQPPVAAEALAESSRQTASPTQQPKPVTTPASAQPSVAPAPSPRGSSATSATPPARPQEQRHTATPAQGVSDEANPRVDKAEKDSDIAVSQSGKNAQGKGNNIVTNDDREPNRLSFAPSTSASRKRSGFSFPNRNNSGSTVQDSGESERSIEKDVTTDKNFGRHNWSNGTILPPRND